MEQHTRTEYELQVVLTDVSGEVQERIRKVLKVLYGEGGRFEVEVVPDLLPGPAGKYRRTEADFEFDQKGLFE